MSSSFSKATSFTLPYYAEDVSALARALTKQLGSVVHKPSHVEMLNVLARAIGHRNYQHLRSSAEALKRLGRLAHTPPNVVDVDYAKIERLSQNFDSNGRLTRWPKKFSHQEPCMWVIWSAVPPREKFNETAVNEFIRAAHTFNDHAILRRELVNYGMMRRNLDCSDYERVERKPSKDAVALIRFLNARQHSTS